MQNNIKDNNTDFEVRSLDAMCVNEENVETPVLHNLQYLFFGMLFGIVLIKSEVVSNWVSILPRYYIIKLENSESTVCKTPRSPKILGLVSPHFVCFKSFHSWYKCSPMKEFYLSVPLGATRYRWLSEDGNFELWNWISSRNCLSLF